MAPCRPRTLLAAAALAALLAGPPAAPAAPRGKCPFRVGLKAVSPKVALGEDMVFEFTVRSGHGKVARIAPLRLGSPSSVTLAIEGSGIQARVSRIYGRFEGEKFKEDALEYLPLKSGGVEKGEIRAMAVRPGKYQVSAFYGGFPADVWDEPVRTEPVEVEVTAGPKGEKRPGARIRTDKGAMTAELYPEKAYNTVVNFLTLARDGFYNRLTFHRIIKGFMIQGGDPKGNGTGGPGYSIALEPNDIKHTRGVLSMAREQARNTGGSQFFVMDGTADTLDGAYAAFGRLLEGKAGGDAVLKALASVPVKQGGDGGMSDPLVDPVLEGVDVLWLP